MAYDDVAQRLRDITNVDTGIGTTEEEIREAESAIGMTFPPDFRWYLRDFGWARVGAWELFGTGHDVPAHLDLVRVIQSERTDMVPTLPTTLLPVANDGAGNLLCLDVGGGAKQEYPIVYRDHETGQSEMEAESFVEWLDRIVDLAS